MAGKGRKGEGRKEMMWAYAPNCKMLHQIIRPCTSFTKILFSQIKLPKYRYLEWGNPYENTSNIIPTHKLKKLLYWTLKCADILVFKFSSYVLTHKELRVTLIPSNNIRKRDPYDTSIQTNEPIARNTIHWTGYIPIIF